MIDSIEKLAQSRTFIVRNGKVSEDDQNQHAARRETLTSGTIVESKYEIIALIGTGGMGVVYKVRHLLLKKDMALKTFLSRRLSQGSLKRFQREAQAIAKLQHKNIIDVYDFGEAEGDLPYYTMELLSGHSLADELKQSGRMDPTDALQIFVQVAEALAHAHRHNIVHRDIKPANIIMVTDSLAPTGSPPIKLVDFGIAKLAESTIYNDDQSLTQAGTIFGSPLYMSPEQSLGLDTDYRTDMYSFGCALYESLTGHPPFVGNTALQTMIMHQKERPATLQDSRLGFAVPQRLEALVEKLLAKNPEIRYQKFDQIVEELRLCSLALASAGLAPSGNQKSTGNTFLVEVKDRLGEDTVEKFQTLPIKKILVGSLAIVILCAGLFAGFNLLNHSAHHNAIVQQATRPFYVGIRQDVDGAKRVFDFGDLQDLGFFVVKGFGKEEQIDCRGEVVVPVGHPIDFFTETICSTRPELMRRFGPDDLHGIHVQLSPEFVDKNLPQLVKEISHLSGLRALDFSALLSLTPEILSLIDNLKDLRELDVKGCTNIQGKDLASLTILPNLEYLAVSDISNLTPLFRALAKNKAQIRILIANRCKFSDEDMVNLGTLPCLSCLSLTRADMASEQLRSLAAAPNLQQLNLTHDYIVPGHIPILAKFTRLRKITLPTVDFPGANMQHLIDALPPHCEIEADNKDSKIIVPHEF